MKYPWSVFPALAAALLLSAPTVRGEGVVHYWSRCHGSTLSDMGNGIAVDSHGNVCVVGQFVGTVSLGGVPLVSAGQNDIFVAKYNTHGVHLWSVRFGGSDYDRAVAVAVGADDRVYAAGTFRGTVDFGGGPFVSAGENDAFVLCLRANGSHEWSRRFGEGDNDEANGLAVDGDHRVLVAGNFHRFIDAGGGTLTSAGQSDVFVACYEPGGSHLWSIARGSTASDYLTGLAVDPWGRVLLSGTTYGAIDFGGGPVPDAGGGDVFLAVLESTGSHRWSRVFGDAAYQYGGGVASDASGDVYLTGFLYGGIDFGGGLLSSAGYTDAFVAGFGPDGEHRWSHRFGSAGVDYGYDLAVDAWGGCHVTGYFQGAVDFGGGVLTSAGQHDVFVAKFDVAGVHRWSRRFGGTGVDAGWDIAIDAESCVYLTGQAGNTVDFGGGPLSTAGGDDVFIAMLGPETGTGVDDARDAALSISACPNPFNPSTMIRYTVPSSGRVTISVYDARGTRVATVVDAWKTAGAHGAGWNGRNGAGEPVPSGVYFARIVHPAGVMSHKMVLLK